METYGFDKLSIRVLKNDLTPDTTKKIHVLDGTPKEGGPTAMELTGLSKEPKKSLLVTANTILYEKVQGM